MNMLKRFSILMALMISLFGYVHASAGSDSSDPSSHYTINLTWINNSLASAQTDIFPASVTDEIVRHAKGWYALNPESEGATVQFWYDSRLTTAEAVAHTSVMFEGSAVRLRDIWEIPLIQENQDVFCDQMPVYFRADLLRVILSWHEVANDGKSCFVFANCNMKPISKAELFDKETVDNLKNYGLVMAYNTTGSNLSDFGTSNFENSFFMMSNHKENMLNVVKEIMLDYCLKMSHMIFQEEAAFNALRVKVRRDHSISFTNWVPNCMPQFVYRCYKHVFVNFYSREYGLEIGIISPKGKLIPIGERFGIEHFMSPYCWSLGYDFENDPFKIFTDDRFLVPTKPIRVPSAKLKYISHQRGNDPRSFQTG